MPANHDPRFFVDWAIRQNFGQLLELGILEARVNGEPEALAERLERECRSVTLATGFRCDRAKKRRAQPL